MGGEIERVTEAATAAPDGTETFPVEDTSNISSRSRESRGLGHNRPVVDVEPYVLPQVPEPQHGMYYTPMQFTQDPYNMPPTYSYPYLGADYG